METMQKTHYPTFGQAVTSDFMTLAQMKADTANAMEGDLTGYNCPKCKNRGYSLRVRDTGFLVSIPCDCMEIRKSIRRMRASGLEAVIPNSRLEDFRVTAPWQEQMKNCAADYAANPSGWLVMCGQPGSGKTHLCTAVCRELLLKGYSVTHMSWRDDIPMLKDYRTESEKREARLEELKNAQVLYVDDLLKQGRGEGGISGADLNLAFELLNYRYNRRALTILSTERSHEELLELDEALGSRIIEMAGKHLIRVKKDRTRNYRMRNVLGE